MVYYFGILLNKELKVLILDVLKVIYMYYFVIILIYFIIDV